MEDSVKLDFLETQEKLKVRIPPFLEYAFIPNVFVDITDTLDKKMKAMRAYHSEVREYPHPRSIEALTIAAKHWGVKVRLDAAEPFLLVREII